MELLNYKLEDFDLKKAIQDNITKNYSKLLKQNGFIKNKQNSFVREKNEILQRIYFKVAKDGLKVFVYILPLFLYKDELLLFGIELTGSSGWDLLGGKYFTTMYETEAYNKEIQYKNYCEEHIYKFEKIYNALEEGVINEMNCIDSFSKLYIRLMDEKTTFFGREYTDHDRKGFLHKYIIGVYECAHGDFEKGVKIIEPIVQYADEFPYTSIKSFDLTTQQAFISSYNELCNQGRVTLKLQTQTSHLN